jgi:diguanylate cyclase (GGDEF)-like protein
MSLLLTSLKIISFYVFPLIVIVIFFALRTAVIPSFINYFLSWTLFLWIVTSWIAAGVWGGIVSALVLAIISLYAWMLTGSIWYPLEILPALILFFLLYIRQEKVKVAETIEKLDIDEKERSYNLLLQEHKKQESLREAYYKKAKRFSILSQIAKELGFILTPEEINRNIIASLRRTIENGDVYMLWGIGPDLQGLELQVLESPGGVLSQEAVSLDEFNTWVMRHRQPLIVTDVSKDYRFNTAEILAKTKVRSIIMAPLITGGRMHGIIRIDSYRPEMFSVDDLRLLAIISNIGVLTLYNAQLYKQTEYLAIRDDLTGLYVKRYLEEKLEAFIAEAEIDKKPFSFLLLDLDRFKDLNDQFGHSIGDKVLQKAAGIMTKAIPPSGIAARWGGEEFAIILPNMDKTSARSLGEDIRKLIEEQRFSIRREDIQTTISIGISEFPSDGNTLIDIVDKADKNLYEAKHKGRNRVVG